MGRLVVAVHLGLHGVAILLVGEQRGHAVLGGNGGGVDAHVARFGARHNLLTPVAEDVGLQARCGLGAVVGQGARQGDGALVLKLVDAGGVVVLVEQVAVPIDAEHVAEPIAVGQTLGMLGSDGADGPVVGRRPNGARHAVGEVGKHATAIVAAAGQTVEDL